MNKSEHFLFYAPDLVPKTVILDETESRHVASVLRIRPGDTLQLTDGKGGIATGVYRSEEHRRLTVSIVSRSHKQRPEPARHLYAGLPDRDAFETILINAAALGVSRIVPLTTAYSQKPWWNNWEKLSARFHLKMIAACKQSHNPYLPELLPPTPHSDTLQQSESTFVLVADLSGKPLRDILLPATGTITCFVGPPGGFSGKELQLLTDRSATAVRIAPGRLRTELASTILCGQLTGALL
jgi:16S rRNA (uracil1498-N3)-methyltransferase